MSETYPELDDESHDDGSVYGERRRRMLRVAVLVALGAMVLPLVLSAYGVAHSAAARVCAAYVATYDADARSRVELDLFGAGGPGWQCAAVAGSGVLTPLGNLGLLPAAPRVPLPGERPT